MTLNTNTFQRDYLLIVKIGNRQIEIAPPFRIQFDCTKATNGISFNKMNIKIFGLATGTRESMTKDAEENKLVYVELQIGYENNLRRLFTGQLHKGSNVLGNDGFETILTVYDGGHDGLNSFTHRSVEGKLNAINAILQDMPNTSKGKITIPQELTRPKVLVGNSYNLFKELADKNQTVFIDDGKINIIRKNEVTSSYIPIVEAATGLINVPQREFLRINFDMIMNPIVKLAGLIDLRSVVAPQYNGIYKVESITYRGDLEGADWSAALNCFSVNNFEIV